LRPRRLEAEQADVIDGPPTRQNAKAGGNHFLAAIKSSHSLRFNNVNLDGTASITCRVANGGEDSRIEFRDGSTEGAILAAVTVKPTGAWNEWIEFTALVKAPAHRTDLCVTFSGVQTNRLLNLDWVQFNR